MNVYMPSEGIVEPPKRRFLDWRFLSALAALLFVAILAGGAWNTWQSRERADGERAALISALEDRSDEVRDLQGQLDRLQRDITAERKAARVDARAAAKERELLIRRQEYLIRVLQRFGILPAEAGPIPSAAVRPAAPPYAPVAPSPSAPPPSAPVSSAPATSSSGSGPPAGPSGNPGPGQSSTQGNYGGQSTEHGGHGPGGNRPPHAGKP